MSELQLWIVIGAPVAVGTIVLLVGGSPIRARVAVGLLVTFALILALVPNGAGASIAVIGLPVIVLVASGRLEGVRRERHHESRRSMTTASSD